MATTRDGARPAIVLPVRDGAALLPAALAGLVPAADAAGGSVVVVDDASIDDTAAVAGAAGALVLTLAEPSGPYVARNAGWRRAAADGATVAVFVDARCRPRPGWLPRLLGALDQPGVALAAGDVAVLPRPHVAGQAAAVLDPLALRHGRSAAFLPYAPTCHLAVPISVLEAVDGFRAIRGGGDVDLCWRVQLGGHGGVAWAEDAVLDWEPRQRVRDLIEQHRRYGANTARLCRAFDAAGCPVPAPTPPWRARLHAARAFARAARRATPGRWPALAVAEAARAAQAIGYARALPDAGANLEAAR